jgi:succinoglycan biosynthesis protein ExoM
MTDTPQIAVVIPTLGRPDSFRRAVRSVLSQTGLEDLAPVQLVLADNNPDGSAVPIAEELAREAPATIKVTIVHEPRAGVSNIRNAALAQVRARHVFFLDDDQTAATTDWLRTFHAAHIRLGSAASFGLVDAALPPGCEHHGAYFQAFFGRSGPATDQLIGSGHGCNNSALDLQQIPFDGPVFDADANEVGGEDDILYGRLANAGASFGWVAGARAFEHVPVSRARLGYTLRRAFAYGQGAPHNAFRRGWRHYPTGVKHMLTGLVQVPACAAVSAMLRPFNRDRSAWWLDKSARGLGKVLWMPVFKFKFYGLPGLQRASASEPPPAGETGPAK